MVVVFFLTIAFLAGTDEGERHGGEGLRRIFGVGSDAGVGGAGWVAQDLGIPGSSGSASNEPTEDLESTVGEGGFSFRTR